jgi:ABC-type sugar transport system substrate-binding protein
MLEQVLSAYYTNKCSFEGQILGTFDANSKIYDAIAISKVAFTISQQQHLQGSLSMVTATLYATSGKSLLEKSSEAQSGFHS